MEELDQEQVSDVLDIATEAGHIMLENGAEISRVEETMRRIASHYGVSAENFFILSNGIFTSGRGNKTKGSGSNGQFASIEFIPIKGTQMDKIVATNTLSRDIEAGKYTLEQAREELARIRSMKQKPAWEQALGSALGGAGFCGIFGGSMLDCLTSFIACAILWIFVIFVSAPYFSKTLGNIFNGLFVTIISYILFKLGLGDSLGDIVVGSLIPLIPGVAFTNGIRDIANEDYIAGMTRLMDAILVFLAITTGACIFFVTMGYFTGNTTLLHGPDTNPFMANIPAQVLFGFIGTLGFAILFGVPAKQYLITGIVGMIDWTLYYVLSRYTSLSVIEMSFIASLATVYMARSAAIIRKCPMTVFLICGLFPLIPGGGIFWTTYFLVTKQYSLALNSGMTAMSVIMAIVLGIMVFTGMPRIKRKKA